MVEDPLPEAFRKANGLLPLGQAIKEMHQPESFESMERARNRLVYEEFLYLQIALQMRRAKVKQEIGIEFPLKQIGRESMEENRNLFGQASPFDSRSLEDQCSAMLPFELTPAQRRVVGEIWADMERGSP